MEEPPFEKLGASINHSYAAQFNDQKKLYLFELKLVSDEKFKSMKCNASHECLKFYFEDICAKQSLTRVMEARYRSISQEQNKN